MEPFKAVDFTRKVRADFDKKYQNLSMEERAEITKKNVESDPFWEAFLSQHKIHSITQK